MNPCGCTTLRIGVTIVGIAELVLVIIYFSVGGYLLNLSKNPNNFDKESLGPEISAELQDFVQVIGITVMVLASIKLILSLVLLLGAVKRNRVACIVWYFFTFILVGLTLIGNVRNVLSAKANSGTVVSFLICGLEAYFLWVVFAFTRELKQDEENPNSQITTFN